MNDKTIQWAAAAIGFAFGTSALAATPHGPAAIRIGQHEIAGQVVGDHGPEAGVWVIAETRDLPTRYAKGVVTDDQGRFVVP